MRVLVVALAARTGGGGTHVVSQIAELASQPGLALTVHASGSVAERLREAAPNASIVAHPARALPRRLLEEQVRLAADAWNFDAVLMLGNFALFACRTPQILVAQNAWYFTDEVRQFRRERCRPARRARLVLESTAARRSIRRATIVATVSGAMRSAIEQDLGQLGHLRVVASAAPRLPAPGCAPSGLPKGPYVLAIAHDDPHKEWDRLIEAFSTSQDLPPLVLAGRAHRDRPRHPRIHLVGEVADRARIAALYAGSACCVAHSRFESFGLTAAEALSMGTPVAASDIPAHREVCGEQAHYYSALDLEDLQRAVASAVHEGRRNPIQPSRTWSDNAGEVAGLLRMIARQSNPTT